MKEGKIISEKELHDSIGAMVFALKLKLDMIKESSEISIANSVRFARIEDYVKQLNKELQAILYTVSTPEGESFSLHGSMENLVAVFSKFCPISYRSCYKNVKNEISSHHKRKVYQVISTFINELTVIYEPSSIDIITKSLTKHIRVEVVTTHQSGRWQPSEMLKKLIRESKTGFETNEVKEKTTYFFDIPK